VKLTTPILKSCSFLFGSLAVLVATFPVIGADGASHQKEKGRNTTFTRDGGIVRIWEYKYIPEATQPCTHEESEWWKQTRNAGNGMFVAWKKRDQKLMAESRNTFLLLITEGRRKEYRVPIEDRPPQVVFHAEPDYSYIARKNKISGTVWASVDITADGTAGDVQVIEGLGWGLDQNAIQALRQFIFLPAVKDGTFVAERKKLGVFFCGQPSGCQR
jgi:TonB family protein